MCIALFPGCPSELVTVMEMVFMQRGQLDLLHEELSNNQKDDTGQTTWWIFRNNLSVSKFQFQTNKEQRKKTVCMPSLNFKIKIFHKFNLSATICCLHFSAIQCKIQLLLDAMIFFVSSRVHHCHTGFKLPSQEMR